MSKDSFDSKKRLLDGEKEIHSNSDIDVESQSTSSEPSHRFGCCSVVQWRCRKRVACERFLGAPTLKQARQMPKGKREFYKTLVFSTVEIVCSFLVSVGIVYVFQLPICDLIFACGCSTPWNGGIDNCNVFNKTGPRCPWCTQKESVGWIITWFPIFTLFLTYLYVASQLKRKYLWVAVLFAVAAFIVMDLILALIFFLTSDYTYLLGFGETPPHRIKIEM